MKKAFITGISGQDGAYLSKLLVEKGYEVYGGYRRSSTLNLWRLEEMGVVQDVRLMPFESMEYNNILRTIDQVQPDEFYNLAAQSFVQTSFDEPIYTSEVDAIGVTKCLEAIRCVNPGIKFYQASTSEMFGRVQEVPQRENTSFYPRSPYGVSKLYAHWMTINYRESYGMKACCGILFNHESPLRGEEFVTRKITKAFVRVKRGLQEFVELGNLNAKRDWGFAGDYVEAMWRMLQQENHWTDYVVATGETWSIRQFVEQAARCLGYNIGWETRDGTEVGVDRVSGKVLVRTNPRFLRPAEVDLLIGDPAKIMADLKWSRTVSFESLVAMMIEADSNRLERA